MRRLTNNNYIDLFLVPLRKVSSKRCLSPSKPTIEDSARQEKAKIIFKNKTIGNP
jgi:hypothetical protein